MYECRHGWLSYQTVESKSIGRGIKKVLQQQQQHTYNDYYHYNFLLLLLLSSFNTSD